jgi:hypothetical protein
MSISSGTPLYWYRKSAWIDPNIYFSDGLSIYAYSNGNLLRATVPIELLNPTDITELPKNTKLLEDRYGAMDCAGKPRWYFGIGSNLINIPIQETELVAYCKACVNCRKH